MNKALEGVRILDMTAFLSGPFAMEIMAYFGAEVIKLEKVGTGDAVRFNGPYYGRNGVVFERKDPTDMSLVILKRSRGKKSITLNTRNPKGKALFLELLKKCDVVAENFAPGTMDRMGLNYDELRKVKPDIILCSVSGFGQTGPYRSLPAFDPVVEGMSGVMEVTGYPDKPPVRMGVAGGDLVASLYMAIGLLTALRYRDKTGKGQAVDISMMDGLVSFLLDEAVDVYADRNMPLRTGTRRIRLTPFNSYQAQDGYVVICSAADTHWANILKGMGREDLIGDPRYAKQDQRSARYQEVDDLVEAWTKTKTKQEVVEIMRNNGVASGIVATIPEVLADPHLKARGMITDLYHPELGKVKGAVGHDIPIKLSATPGSFDTPAPYLGAQNEEIFGGLLGLSREQLEELKKDKTV